MTWTKTIRKAASLAGFPIRNVREIDCDEDFRVQPDEREAREVVVEGDMRAPALRRVALVAASAERPQVHIARAMAADALRAELLGRGGCGVTDVAAHLGVLADQRPLGIACVIEGRGFPGLVAVTLVISMIVSVPVLLRKFTPRN